MKLVYIAGPYRAATPWGVEQNIRAAEDVAVLVHKAGMFAVCPHANSRHMEGIAEDAHFLAGTLEIMRRCDAVLLVPGWQRSEGSRAEVTEATAIGIPVFGSDSRTTADEAMDALVLWRDGRGPYDKSFRIRK